MFGLRNRKSAIARARLLALRQGWVPTSEILAKELSHDRGEESQSDSSDQPEATFESPDFGASETRWQVDSHGARALVLLAVGAVAGGLVVVLLGWPRGEAAPVQVSPITQAPAEATESSTAAMSSGMLLVDVAGAVKRPGVVELPAGSRVIDALDAAGGVSPRANTSALNLAQILNDGQQVLVQPGDAEPAPAGSGGVSTSPGAVSINNATLEQLDTLPGIGPVLAQAIIDWRTENGGFTAIEQLQEVSGIGEATFADVQGLVTL